MNSITDKAERLAAPMTDWRCAWCLADCGPQHTECWHCGRDLMAKPHPTEEQEQPR